jgi:hypothetical protein
MVQRRRRGSIKAVLISTQFDLDGPQPSVADFDVYDGSWWFSWARTAS